MPRVWWSSTEDEGQSIKFGAVASFYCPENEDFDDKYIACDISQSYNEYYNVDRATNTLYEPIIAGRHIFHIKNGKTFADEFSGSPENNKKYVKEHKRYITARTNAPFQVRLDFPMPLEKDGKTGKSGLYYKAADGSYKSVYGYEIRSYNVTNRTEIPVANFMGYTGLGPFVADHICYGDSPRPKSENLRILLERNGITSAEAVYVGDTQSDCYEAHKAGTIFALMEYGFGNADDADLRFASFHSLTEYFEI